MARTDPASFKSKPIKFEELRDFILEKSIVVLSFESLDYNQSMESSRLSDSQVLHSSSLDSPSSEQPDIRNWFSSYVYESPNLDSIENFGDSISRKRGFEEYLEIADEDSGSVGTFLGEFGGVSKIDEEEAADKLPRTWIPMKCTSLVDHRGRQPLGMNQDSWSSQSLLSEPPDVGNWFSSYAYESPTLNPSQEFGSCESESAGLDDRIEETFENVRKTKSGGEGGQLNQFVKCSGNSRGNRQDNQPLRESLFFERTTEQDPKQKSQGTNKISPSKEVPISNLTTEGLQCNFQDRVSQENGRSSNEDNKKPATHTNLIPKIDITLENSQQKLNGSPARTHVPSVLTNRNPIDLSNTRENKGKRVSEDGFVTANKHEFCGATCKKSVERQESFNNKETGSGFGCLSRKPLSDKTNVEHCDIVEIIGKWSCPQKSKPNLGPPLKQLRLERWIHKK